MIKNQLEVITVRFNFRLHEGHFVGWGKDVSRVSLSTSLHPSQEREGIGGQIVEKEGESVMNPEKGYKCGHSAGLAANQQETERKRRVSVRGFV